MSDSENKLPTMPYGLPQHSQSELQYHLGQLHQLRVEVENYQTQLHQTQGEL